jgi:hypothetical protein
MTLLACLTACGPKIAEAPENLPPFSELALRCQKWMVGSFANDQQVRESESCPGMVLQQRAIWESDTTGLWIYSETIETGKPVRPEDQVIYRIKDDMSGGVLIETYRLPGNPSRFAGAWREPESFDRFAPFELTLRGNCDLHLKRRSDGSIGGGTEGTDCGSTQDGASYQTEELTLGSMELSQWRRGFDASGTQVWGETSGPFSFERSNAAARPESIKPGSDHVPDVGPYNTKK